MYRNELKYLIDPLTAISLHKKIEVLLQHDKHADAKGYYKVTSLYFDDYANTALNDNLAGTIKRKKYRIRVYNKSKDYIRLEKKVKHHKGGFKASVLINAEQYLMILNDDYIALKASSDHILIQEFCLDAITRQLKPKIVVEYDRKSFIYDFGTVRITFDYNIKHSLGEPDLLDEHILYAPAMDDNTIVMEVKFTGALPEVIKKLIQQSVSTRQSISKYSLSRTLAF